MLISIPDYNCKEEKMISNHSHFEFNLFIPTPESHLYTRAHITLIHTKLLHMYPPVKTQAEAFIGHSGPSEKSDAAINGEMKDTRLAAE